MTTEHCHHCRHCHPHCPGGDVLKDWAGRWVYTFRHLSADLETQWPADEACPLCAAGAPETPVKELPGAAAIMQQQINAMHAKWDAMRAPEAT